MPRSGRQLSEILEPVRDQYVVVFAATLRRLGTGEDGLAAEPIRIATSGEIWRRGVLNLPCRDDYGYRNATGGRQVDTAMLQPVHDETHALRLGDTLVCRIQPFVWNSVWIAAVPPCDSALQIRVRLWFLDWFQARRMEEWDGLCGSLHKLDGPFEFDGAHWFRLDLGTAPIDALVTLIDLLADGGAEQCRIGDTPKFDLP